MSKTGLSPKLEKEVQEIMEKAEKYGIPLLFAVCARFFFSVANDDSPNVRKKEGGTKMGMVHEQENMEKEVCEMLKNAGDIQLLSTQINASTALSVYARPLSYDIHLGGKKVLSFNCPENAITVYHAMRADFKGDIWHG